MAPESKIAAAFAFVLCVALTPRQAVWAFLAYGGVLLAVILVAGLRIRSVLVRLAAVLPFIAFAFLIPFVSSGERIDLLGVQVSAEGVWAMWNIGMKALLGATVSILLASTTEVPELLKGLGRLHAPAIFVSITSFMVRYLEMIAGDLGRMRTAMAARGYRPRWLWQARPIAAAAGALFIRSYERSERVYAAMLSRGYTGVMPVLGSRRATRSDWAWAAAPPLAGIAIVAAALVTA